VQADKLDFLGEKEPEEVTPEPQVEEPAPPEETPEPTGEQTAEPAPSVPPTPEPEPQRIPLTAMLDEREKRQKAERELEEMRRQIAAMKEPPKVPDFYEDADGRLAYERRVIEQRAEARVLSQAKALAEREYGKELVAEAIDFFHQPEFAPITQRMIAEPLPFHSAVEFYKKQKFLSEVQDPDKWREQERERIRQELLAQSPAPSKPTAPPPSLSKAPSRGNDAIAPGNAFDSMFPG
jgi:hypothetical protein